MSHVATIPTEGLYHDPVSGLDCLYFKSGYSIEDTAYGEAVSFQGGWDLLAAASVIKGCHPLRGQEVRFLRGLLDVSQAMLAQGIGTTRATIARWEAAVTGPQFGHVEDRDLPAWGDTSVRLLAAARLGLSGMSCLPEVSKQQTARLLILDHDGHRWRVAGSTFGASGGDLDEDPLAHRRLICALFNGNFYGPEEAAVVARFEAATVEEAWRRAEVLVAGIERWYLMDRGEVMLASHGCSYEDALTR